MKSVRWINIEWKCLYISIQEINNSIKIYEGGDEEDLYKIMMMLNIFFSE